MSLAGDSHEGCRWLDHTPFLFSAVSHAAFPVCLLFRACVEPSAGVCTCPPRVPTRQAFAPFHLLHTSLPEPSDLLGPGLTAAHTWHPALLLESLFITQAFLCLSLQVDSLSPHPPFGRNSQSFPGKGCKGVCVNIWGRRMSTDVLVYHRAHLVVWLCRTLGHKSLSFRISKPTNPKPCYLLIFCL